MQKQQYVARDTSGAQVHLPGSAPVTYHCEKARLPNLLNGCVGTAAVNHHDFNPLFDESAQLQKQGRQTIDFVQNRNDDRNLHASDACLGWERPRATAALPGSAAVAMVCHTD